MSIFKFFFGDSNKKYLKKTSELTEKINNLESKFEKLSDKNLKERIFEFKEKLKKIEKEQEIKDFLNEILTEVFAITREASKRALHQRHFNVQILGGMALHEGKVVQMLTGEGKTLAATLPIVLNALSQKGVHIITVNDYLAKRDTVWMGQIYNLLGLSVGCLNHEQSFLYDPIYRKLNEKDERDKIRDEVGSFYIVEDFLKPCSKKEAYSADITYGTNTEFGFDYLRDNLAHDNSVISQRELNFVIIDEVDSILIDEARTPLIISQPQEESPEDYYKFSQILEKLKEDANYNLDEKMKSCSFTEQGQEKIITFLGFDPWEKNDISALHKLDAALRAKTFFQIDKDYVIKDGKIVIVDEFTGRLLPGRRFSEGLHQAIEAKEHVKGNFEVQVQPESRTIATISLQNYFHLYKKIAGMTGTALSSAEEFDKVYGLEVIDVPPNRPMIRKDFSDKIYKTESEKFTAIVKEIKEKHKAGQPLLVGTKSIEKNEYLGKLLEREGISHQILNAKNHEKEGEIIAQAGKLGAVTIATNMAGRGVDIILGGNPPVQNQRKEILSLGGLYVIGTERHEDRRIDNQLRGRGGRQGDPGFTQFFTSFEDDLIRIFGGERIKGLMERLKFPEGEAIENKIISNIIETAQKKIEGMNFDTRKHLLEYDNVLVKQREAIYKKRKEFLEFPQILKILEKEIKGIVDFHCQNNYSQEWNIEEIFERIKTIFPFSDEIHLKLSQIRKEKKSPQILKEELLDCILNPLKDGFLKKEKETGRENFEKLSRFVSLKIIDSFWTEHLSNMEHLRDSVYLRAYGGKDPLVEYKRESYKLFQRLLKTIETTISQTIFKVSLQPQAAQVPKPSVINKREIGRKVGRNDPCPCGSGKKYKKCCLPKYG